MDPEEAAAARDGAAQAASARASSAAADFWLGERRVRPSLNLVEGPDGVVQVEPKVMEVLLSLAGHGGRVVSKEELVREVWGGRFVSDDVVWRSVRELRRALGDDARNSVFIQTIAKRGYRLVAPVGAERASAAAASPAGSAGSPASANDAHDANVVHDANDANSANAAHDASRRRASRRARAALGVVVALIGALAAARLVLGPAGPRGGRPGSGAVRVRLAVLPFANLSGDKAQDFFSDGLTEELISRLGSLKPAELGVIGRTSVMAFKGRGGDAREIGRSLGVDYLLEGGVRREGERVRITAQLVSAADRTTLWSERMDLNLWGTIHLQSAVAERVASALAVRLLPGERERLQRAAAANPRAHDAYLRGRYLLNQGTPEGLRGSVAAFDQAVALDPGAAPALAGLADSLNLFALFGLSPPREAYPRAERAALRALELDPALAEAHTVLGTILFRYRWRWGEAEEELRSALALNPSSAAAHHDYAWLLVSLGRFDQALAEIGEAKALEPLSMRAAADVGWVEYRARRYPEAIAEMRGIIERAPDLASARECLVRALAHAGRLEEARAAARAALPFQGATAREVAALTAGDAATARRRVAAWRFERLLGKAPERFASPYNLAALSLETGRREAAFAWLERAFDQRDASLVTLAVDPEFDPLRADPRLRRLLGRIGLPVLPSP
ncbi:MAG TPA: winged helix-turn-helix domain-containing protein [Thermoanaerobaculia bacterium]|nr:winged helix-turn-helix domain-containing protein [Thermoanaerobaculia bacterium]